MAHSEAATANIVPRENRISAGSTGYPVWLWLKAPQTISGNSRLPVTRTSRPLEAAFYFYRASFLFIFFFFSFFSLFLFSLIQRQARQDTRLVSRGIKSVSPSWKAFTLFMWTVAQLLCCPPFRISSYPWSRQREFRYLGQIVLTRLPSVPNRWGGRNPAYEPDVKLLLRVTSSIRTRAKEFESRLFTK